MGRAGTVFALVLFGAFASCAQAAGPVPTCVAPPGTAAIEEYCELVFPPTQRTRRPSETPAITRDTIRKLIAVPNGRAAARTLGRFRVGERRPSVEARSWQPPSYPATVPGIFSAVGQGSALGTGFVVILVALLAAMGGWWYRTRRGTDASDVA